MCLQGPEGVPDPVAGTELALLLAGPEREDECALRPLRRGREGPGDLEQRRHPGGVVVGTGVHDVAHPAQVVHVGADHDRLLAKLRVRARDEPDHVSARDQPLGAARADRDRHPGQRDRVCLRGGDAVQVCCGQDGVGGGRGDAHERQRFGFVPALERQEEPRLDRLALATSRVANSSPSTPSTATAPAARAVSSLAAQRSRSFSAPYRDTSSGLLPLRPGRETAEDDDDPAAHVQTAVVVAAELLVTDPVPREHGRRRQGPGRRLGEETVHSRTERARADSAHPAVSRRSPRL